MMSFRLDLESKLLLVAIGTCFWGAAQLIQPVLIPNSISAVTIVVIGEIFALWCSDKGPHAVARLAVLSVCFGTQSVAFLSRNGDFLLAVSCAVVSVYCAWLAVEKYRKTKRKEEPAVVSAMAESPVQIASKEATVLELPMLPVRDMVIVPGMKTPFVVGRGSSVLALEYAQTNNSNMFLATQHDDTVADPKATEISKFGCICKVLQSIKMADGNFKVLVKGIDMAKAVATDDSKGFFFATVQGLNCARSVTPAA